MKIVSDIFWLQDSAGIYLDCNQAFERLVGLSAGEILGQRDEQVLEPGLAESLWQRDRDVSPGETSSHRAWLRYDGEPRLFEITRIPLRANGGLLAVQGLARDITRQHIRWWAHQVGYERLVTLSEHIPAAVAMLDRNLRYLFASRRWITDYRPATPDIINRGYYEVFPQTSEQWREIHQRCLVGTSERGLDDLLVRGDGSQMWVSWEIHPWYDSDGEIGGIVIASEDISARKQTEQKLRLQALVLDQIQDSVVITDLDGVISYLNRAQSLMLQAPRRSWIGRHVSLFGDLPGSDATRQEILDLTRTLGEWSGRVASPAADGATRSTHLRTTLVKDEDDRPIAMVGIGTDITEQLATERALMTSQRQLSDIIDFLPDATLAIDRDKRVIIWNKAIEAMTGIPASQMLGRGDHLYTVPFYGERRRQLMDILLEDDPDVGRWYSGLVRVGDTITAETFCGALNGGKGAWIYVKASPLRDQAGRVTGVIEIMRDITERKRAEEALRRSQEIFSLFMRHSPIYTFIRTVSSSESRFLQASDNFELMFGVRGADISGKSVSEVFPPDLATQVAAEDWAVVSSGERLVRDEEYDGRYYTTIKFPILQGRETLLAGYTIDITERKRLEAALQQQATTDELTGLVNRRHFLHLAAEEMRRAQRLDHPFGIALIDLDNLKHINDTFGHAAGDQALIALARLGRETLRAIDVLARFGGDEFALLLPEATPEQAYEALERLRRAVSATQVAVDGRRVALGISAGVVGATEHTESLDMLLQRADSALYEAKANGRNWVVLG